MSSVPGHGGHGYGPAWDTYEDVDRPSRGSTSVATARRGAVPHSTVQQGYSNEALVDGDEYFSDQTDYEEHYLARRQRQNSGTSLTSREPPVGASPVHAAGGFEGIATYEQRRLTGKSMPQLNDPRERVPPQPQPRHRYEVIPSHASPPPPPQRPGKVTPTRRSNGTASTSTPPRKTPVRTPSTSSLLRRGPANGVSTPASRFAANTPTAVLSSPATSPLRKQEAPVRNAPLAYLSPSTPRRNLTPLMNSMSPKPLPRTPRQNQQQQQQQLHYQQQQQQQYQQQQQQQLRVQQFNHRRSMSMSSNAPRTAVIAPSTYTSYDLAGRAYGSGSRPRCELEDDMAEMQASFLSQQSSLEPLMRRSPRRKSMSPSSQSTPLTPPPSMDMQQLSCSRGTVGPAVRIPNSPSSPASSKLNKSSWISLPGVGAGLGASAPTGILAATGIVLLLSGALSSVLCFYMLSQKGRQYYLDFGALAAFASLMLGVVGLRSRVGHLLPNRNYVTGYILVAAFSVLTAAGLLTLLLLPAPIAPRLARLQQGTPLTDIAGGAVCGTAALTLLLAATGTLTSYCCRYPPPDNRVAHAAEGFSV